MDSNEISTIINETNNLFDLRGFEQKMMHNETMLTSVMDIGYKENGLDKIGDMCFYKVDN